MRALLDTSVLIGPEPDLGDAEVAISSASLAELHFGVLAARNSEVRAERLRRLGLIEKIFDALPVDDAVAREYAHLAAAAVEAGHHPRVTDLLVAATARAHAAELWTRDSRAFAGVESLVVLRSL